MNTPKAPPSLQFPPTKNIRTYHLCTPFGQIYIVDSNNPEIHDPSLPTLLLLHGNSSCTRIWHPLLTSGTPLIKTHRILAIDLPGHGCSDNASNPESVYTLRGYAECAIYVLAHLGISKFAVLGWSLGGHIAIEMLALTRDNQHLTSNLNLSLHPEMKGMMLVGTPPSLGAEQVMRGFYKERPSPAMKVASQEVLNPEAAYDFARETSGPPFEEWQRDAVARTDGRSRSIMFSTFMSGVGVNQVEAVEKETEVLVSVVNGAEDPFVNLDYLDQLHWGRLQGGKCVRLSGLRHAPFWEDVHGFYPCLEEFLLGCIA